MFDKLITVVHVLSCLGGVVFPLLSLLMVYYNVEYQDSLQQKLDRINGIKRTWPVKWWMILSIVCWSLIYITW